MMRNVQTGNFALIIASTPQHMANLDSAFLGSHWSFGKKGNDKTFGVIINKSCHTRETLRQHKARK